MKRMNLGKNAAIKWISATLLTTAMIASMGLMIKWGLVFVEKINQKHEADVVVCHLGNSKPAICVLPNMMDYVEEVEEKEILIPDPEPVSHGDYPESGAFVITEAEPESINMAEVKTLIVYPEIAKDADISGQVVLRILVDKKGEYVRHEVIKKVHPTLSNAVEKHIHKLVFKPAIQDGKPIAFWVNIPFRFKL